MLYLASTAHQDMALGQFIFAVGTGLTVLLLGYMARSIRSFMKEHRWLVEKVEENSEAIRELLEERRRGRVVPEARPRRGEVRRKP